MLYAWSWVVGPLADRAWGQWHLAVTLVAAAVLGVGGGLGGAGVFARDDVCLGHGVIA